MTNDYTSEPLRRVLAQARVVKRQLLASMDATIAEARIQAQDADPLIASFGAARLEQHERWADAVRRELGDYAYHTPAGVQAECPTTHEVYIGAQPTYTRLPGGRLAVNLRCRCCDAYRRTGVAYDPAEAQSHMYVIDEVCDVAT